MFFSSIKYHNHYYCYLTNSVFLIDLAKETVRLIDDKYTLEIANRYSDKEVNELTLLLKLKYLVSNYLVNTIEDRTNLIIKYTNLHKELNK